MFNIDHGFRFVRRIPTWKMPPRQKPEDVKGIAASARAGRIYVTNLSLMMALDAVTGRPLWDNAYEGGCDRPAISPPPAKGYKISTQPHQQILAQTERVLMDAARPDEALGVTRRTRRAR